MDDTLIDHDGKFIKDVGWFCDHAEDRVRDLSHRRLDGQGAGSEIAEGFRDHRNLLSVVSRYGA